MVILSTVTTDSVAWVATIKARLATLSLWTRKEGLGHYRGPKVIWRPSNTCQNDRAERFRRLRELPQH